MLGKISRRLSRIPFKTQRHGLLSHKLADRDGQTVGAVREPPRSPLATHPGGASRSAPTFSSPTVWRRPVLQGGARLTGWAPKSRCQVSGLRLPKGKSKIADHQRFGPQAGARWRKAGTGG
jgi:hypothetical protein